MLCGCQNRMLEEAAKRLSKPGRSTNWAWKYFSKYNPIFEKDKSSFAVCDLCLSKLAERHVLLDEDGFIPEAYVIACLANAEVNIGKSQSPAKLEQHMRSTHKEIMAEHTQKSEGAKASQQSRVDEGLQFSLGSPILLAKASHATDLPPPASLPLNPLTTDEAISASQQQPPQRVDQTKTKSQRESQSTTVFSQEARTAAALVDLRAETAAILKRAHDQSSSQEEKTQLLAINLSNKRTFSELLYEVSDKTHQQHDVAMNVIPAILLPEHNGEGTTEAKVRRLNSYIGVINIIQHPKASQQEQFQEIRLKEEEEEFW